jgi:hypothetical protein
VPLLGSFLQIAEDRKNVGPGRAREQPLVQRGVGDLGRNGGDAARESGPPRRCR